MEICPSQRGKVKLEQKFLKTNNGLVRFEILMHHSQDTRPSPRTSSWADVYDKCNFVEIKSFEVFSS
jgi:hypothetical protein